MGESRTARREWLGTRWFRPSHRPPGQHGTKHGVLVSTTRAAFVAKTGSYNKCAALNGLGHVAADLGQEVRLEVHGQCAPPPRIARILEAADHSSVKVCWNSNAQDLDGEGLAAHFELLRPWFGDTAHVRRLDFDGYPTRDLVGLMKASGYDGWVLLEQGGQPPADLVAALRDQRERFASLVGDE